MSAFYKEYNNFIKSNEANSVKIGIEGLKKYLGSNICITSTSKNKKNESAVNKDKLREGEISAVIYSIGSFMIKESVMLYKNCETASYLDKIPADPELITAYREKNSSNFSAEFMKCQLVREIYVADKNNPNLKWNFVCLLAKDDFYHSHDKIQFIGNIKNTIFTHDKNRDLLIFITCSTSKYWSGSWYRISLNGTVKKYPIPYDEKYSDIKHKRIKFEKSQNLKIDENTVTDSIINEIFMFEDDMKSYLCNHKSELSKTQIIDMISSARIDIEKKLKMFEQLAQFENLAAEISANPHNIDDIMCGSYALYVQKFNNAVKETQNPIESDRFMLKSYDYENNEVRMINEKLYSSIGTALYNTIFHYRSIIRIEYCAWYRLEKWHSESCKYDKTHEFIVDNAKIIYFNDLKSGFKSYPNPNLNLPIPFKSGDIVTTNSYPFTEIKQAIIIDVGNNIDCDSVKILYVTSDGVIKVNSLKHGHIFKDEKAEMYTSPLYTLKIFDGELKGNDEILLKVKRFMTEKQYESHEYYNIFRVFDGKNIIDNDVNILKAE